MLTDNAAGEWEEEVKEPCLTPEEELIQTSEYLQYEKKIAELQQKLQVSEEGRLRLMHTDSVSVQQSETEVEKLARELFSRIPDVSVESSFYAAQSWIAERNRRRKESGK